MWEARCCWSRVGPAHLRRQTGAACRDDVDAGQDVPGRVRTGGEYLRSSIVQLGTVCTLTDVADQVDDGLRLGGRWEGEDAGKREQRRGGQRPGGADERAPRAG